MERVVKPQGKEQSGRALTIAPGVEIAALPLRDHAGQRAKRRKQQQQNDAVLKDLFGVSGSLLQELKQSITGLQKGELITRDSTNMALGIGKPWQKIKVTHLI